MQYKRARGRQNGFNELSPNLRLRNGQNMAYRYVCAHIPKQKINLDALQPFRHASICGTYHVRDSPHNDALTVLPWTRWRPARQQRDDFVRGRFYVRKVRVLIASRRVLFFDTMYDCHCAHMHIIRMSQKRSHPGSFIEIPKNRLTIRISQLRLPVAEPQ